MLNGNIGGEQCDILSINADGSSFWYVYIDGSGNLKLKKDYQGVNSITSATSTPGGGSVVLWNNLPTGTSGDRLAATLSGAPIVAEKGALRWHPSYPTKVQLDSLWPNSDQYAGVRVGAMKRYWRALAEGRSPKILFLTDSTGSPGWMSVTGNLNSRSYSWPTLVANALGWRDGSAYAGSSRLESITFGNQLDTRVAYTSASSFGGAVIYTMGDAWSAPASPAKSMTFTPATAFDKLIVKGIATTGSSAARTLVYVDGTLVGSLNHDDILTNQNPSMVEVNVAVTRNTHTVTLTTSGASGNVYINAIETYDSQSLTPNFFSTGVNNNKMLYLADISLPYNYRACIQDLQPDVVVLSCTINDLDSGITIEQMQALNQTFFSHLDKVDCDFVGVCGWATNRPNITKAKLDIVYQQLSDFAQSRNGAVVDQRAVTGYTYAEVDPAIVADDWHLKSAGHTILANQFIQVFQ